MTRQKLLVLHYSPGLLPPITGGSGSRVRVCADTGGGKDGRLKVRAINAGRPLKTFHLRPLS